MALVEPGPTGMKIAAEAEAAVEQSTDDLADRKLGAVFGVEVFVGEQARAAEREADVVFEVMDLIEVSGPVHRAVTGPRPTAEGPTRR